MEKFIRFMAALAVLIIGCGAPEGITADPPEAVGQINQGPSVSSAKIKAGVSNAVEFKSHTEWRLQFERPATADETLRVLGAKNEQVREILHSNPYDQGGGGIGVKNGDVETALRQLDQLAREAQKEFLVHRPAYEQVAQNSDDARKSVAAMKQALQETEATLRYFETRGVPISGVRFRVLPGQEQQFLRRWSTPISANLPRFKITRPLNGFTLTPSFQTPNR